MAHLRDEQGNPIQLTDEFGNPVTLTDEHGRPVQLSGVAYSADTPGGGGGAAVAGAHPNVIPGVGDSGVTYSSGTPVGGVGADGEITSGTTVGEVLSGAAAPRVGPTAGQVHRSTSSSSSSSEEGSGEGEYELEGETRRRKKKGITQKLKEKLSFAGGKPKDKETEHITVIPGVIPVTTGVAPHNIATTDTTTQKMTVEHVEKEKGGAFVASETTTTTVTREHRDQAKKGVIEKIMEKLSGHHSSH